MDCAAVDIKRPFIPVPEIVTDQAPIAVGGDMRSQARQQVVYACIDMRRQRRTRPVRVVFERRTGGSGALSLSLL